MNVNVDPQQDASLLVLPLHGELALGNAAAHGEHKAAVSQQDGRRAAIAVTTETLTEGWTGRQSTVGVSPRTFCLEVRPHGLCDETQQGTTSWFNLKVLKALHHGSLFERLLEIQ
ncbi:unnamed protein product [Arctogadus glacialis]